MYRVANSNKQIKKASKKMKDCNRDKEEQHKIEKKITKA